MKKALKDIKFFSAFIFYKSTFNTVMKVLFILTLMYLQGITCSPPLLALS